MAKVIDISELISLVCDKLIEYGVQPHTVWSDYSYNYRPILHFFQEHGCSHYDEGLLMQYRQEQQDRYEREDLLRKNYLNKTRAVSRLQEFYSRGDLSHVVAGGHAKKHINNANENLLREFIAWSEPANPKTLLDMEWAVRKYLFWLETQGVDDALDVNAHSFSGFMTLASRKYAEGSLHDLQLFLKSSTSSLIQRKAWISHMNSSCRCLSSEKSEFSLRLQKMRYSAQLRRLTGQPSWGSGITRSFS